ncbi:MAG: ribonuclease HII [Lachnospiraceae bacterium]|nr:ribonuclease HII [Lachnospiraceae bacterium]
MTGKEERERKRQEKLLAEWARLDAMCAYENEYASCESICGIDEVGRGPLAGPVVTAAVILPKDKDVIHSLEHLNDSKKLTEKRRETLFSMITSLAVAYATGWADEKRIDEINILQADYEAMTTAVHSLAVRPDLLLLDAVHVPQLSNFRQVSIIKGDGKSVSIAAASILAKVTRDRYMVEMAEVYPEYGFDRNKGYGTAEHIAALKKHGPCPLHRRSFIGGILEGS